MSELSRRRLRMAMVVAPILLALFVIWTARAAVFPFLIGLALAYVIAPAVTGITGLIPFRDTRPYLARGLAIIVLYASVAGLAVGLAFLVVPAAASEIEEFFDEFPATVDSARERLTDLYDRYIPAEQHETTDRWLNDASDSIGDWAAGLAPDAIRFAGSTFSIIIGYLTIPIWLFFVLKDHPRGVRSFIGMFPPEWRHDVRNVLGIGDAVFKNYIRAILIQGVVVGVMAYIALEFLDVDYPVGLAVIAGFTEMIPVIGPIIGAVPAILVALADDPLKALWVALAFFAIQQIENNLIVPKIQGDFLRLHPAVIIVLLVVAGAIGGILWIILVVPVASLVRDLYQYAYLRLGEVPPDTALVRALGDHGAAAIETRLRMEAVVPASDLGNRGLGSELALAPAPAPAPVAVEDGAAGAPEPDETPEPEGVEGS